jgi:PAS domain S-box-containing protein
MYDSGVSGMSVLAQLPDAVIFADRAGSIRMWNRAAEAIFGFTAVEANGASLDMIIPERLRAAHWHGFDAAIESGTLSLSGRATLTRALHRSGRPVYVEISFGLVRDDQSGGVLGGVAVARDVTARIAAEHATVPGAATAAAPA